MVYTSTSERPIMLNKFPVITAARTDANIFEKVFPIKIVANKRLGLLSITLIL